MSDRPPIPTPLPEQWRRVRYQLVPVLTFIAIAVVGAWLWGRHRQIPQAIGEVEAVRLDLTSPAHGRLLHVGGSDDPLFRDVAAGDVLYRLDDEPVRAALDAVIAERSRLEKELASIEAQLRQEWQLRQGERAAERRRLAMDVEQARLDLLDRQGQMQTEHVQLERLGERFEAVRQAYERGVETQFILTDLQLERDVSAERLAGYETSVAEAQRRLDACRERLEACPEGQEDLELEPHLAPIREAIAVQEARMRELDVQVRSLSVRSPLDGIVVAVYLRAGQPVRAGEAVLTLAASRGRYVLTYVRENQRAYPVAGAPVALALRSAPEVRVTGTIERVGPQVEPVPLHQLRDPRMPEWGLPVRIALADGASLRPGELVDVTFLHP